MKKMVRDGHINKLLLIIIVALVFSNCDNSKNKTIAPPKLVVPKFNADSAYTFIEKQLSFGPRVPSTKEHLACKNWLVHKLNEYGAKTKVQEFEATIYNGDSKKGYNIIAQFNPSKSTRILLAAHWDTRIVADKDTKDKNKPIMGADDGASGVAALIEIARNIQLQPIDIGIDIILFDLEDQGNLDGSEERTDNWALGSKHWRKNTIPPRYKAKFGILLDMIAAKGAIFGKEQYSTYYAKDIQDKIWRLAQGMGHGTLFQDFNSGAVGDDHVAVNNMGIPMVDIINRPMKTKSGFGDYHHTHRDDIDIISKENLRIVGQLVTTIIYRSAAGRF